MKTKPLPQNIKTELARILVFSDDSSYVELAYRLRFLANCIERLHQRECEEFHNKSINRDIFRKIEFFYQQMQAGDYDHPLNLARAIDGLSNSAWDEVNELYQSALRIP
ncbi:MAG: hypothetical protein V7L23_09970 [Nostoc sp.]|uniref:hypothetical protein n=1 Tax=Nostoc sp. TaxID=1180 RepID=UPI002FEFAE72